MKITLLIICFAASSCAVGLDKNGKPAIVIDPRTVVEIVGEVQDSINDQLQHSAK